MSLKPKIAAAALTVAGTLMLCGCGTKLPFTQKAPNFDTTYTVTADITYDKLKAKANLTRATADEWEMTFTEPKELNGIVVRLNNNKYSASLGGMSFSSEHNSVYSTAPQIIAKAVGSLANSTENATSSDGVITITTELDGKRVTVTANERNGDLISLKCPQHKLSVNFSDQKPYTLVLPEENATIS